MPKELFVTLNKSDNEYLSYPCKGWLELFELGADGSVITGVWRGLNPDGSRACPVEVRNVAFEYSGGKFKSAKSQVGPKNNVVMLLPTSASVRSAIASALAHVENGDPVDAASELDVLLQRPDIDLVTRKQLEKATEEITIGDPAKAESYLTLVAH